MPLTESCLVGAAREARDAQSDVCIHTSACDLEVVNASGGRKKEGRKEASPSLPL